MRRIEVISSSIHLPRTFGMRYSPKELPTTSPTPKSSGLMALIFMMFLTNPQYVYPHPHPPIIFSPLTLSAMPSINSTLANQRILKASNPNFSNMELVPLLILLLSYLMRLSTLDFPLPGRNISSTPYIKLVILLIPTIIGPL